MITQEYLLKSEAMKDEYKSEIEKLECDIRELGELKSSLKAKIDEIDQKTLSIMVESGQSKAEFDFAKVSLPKARKIVNLTNEDVIPDKYKTKKESVTVDKKLLKKDLDAGVNVMGAELIDGKQSLKVEVFD